MQTQLPVSLDRLWQAQPIKGKKLLGKRGEKEKK